MRGWDKIRGAILALCTSLLLVGAVLPAQARGQCLSFGQARKLGLFAKFNLRPAARVKNSVEARTGGKVVSFLVCRSGSGPFYQLTVVRPNGNVENISVPAN